MNKSNSKLLISYIIHAIILSIIGIVVLICLKKVLNAKANDILQKPSKEKESMQNESNGNVDKDNSVNENPEWAYMLVNPWNKLPEDYHPKLKQLSNGQKVDERIYSSLEKMLNDAMNSGLSPMVCSSYRTSEKQTTLYKNEVSSYVAQGYSKKKAEEAAAKWVAIPGTSEHQTGLAVDIVAVSYQNLDEGQENTAEQRWLMKNAHKYGFILRYPSNKRELTGINYEPWHYRYVGIEAAKEIYENGLCLEEYLRDKSK